MTHDATPHEATTQLPLAIHGYGSTPIEGVPESRTVALPPDGAHARRPRLATLARQLANVALGVSSVSPELTIYLGTALGSLTETASFLENLFENAGAAPKPRAFTHSVHNAAASHVGQTVTARGENQTFVHGEVSSPIAAWSAIRSSSPLRLFGGLDEWTTYVERGRIACGGATARAEGGALFFHDANATTPPLARLTDATFGRPRDPLSWLRDQLARTPVDRIVWGGALGIARAVADTEIDAACYFDITGDHPSAAATAVAHTIASIERGARERVAVVTESRFGDWAFVAVAP